MKRTFFYLAVFLFLTSIVWAYSWPEKPRGYVHDDEALLSQNDREEIEKKISDFDQKTSNQIFVGIFPSLNEEPLESVSIRLMDLWKPGTKKNNNGVLFLIFPNDRKMRIEVGYGLEGALPDALCRQIIEDEASPSFKEGRFTEGIQKVLDAIMLATAGEYQAKHKTENLSFDPSLIVYGSLVLYAVLPWLAYLIVVFLCVANLGLIGWLVAAVIIFLLEIFRRMSPHEGSTYSDRGYSRSSGGSWGGGFSGGGGGRGGGGGASGSW